MKLYWMRVDAVPEYVVEALRRLEKALALPSIAYRFRIDAVRHLTGVGLAAMALAEYGGVNGSTRLHKDPGGKPFFLTDGERVEFSISHSGDYVVCMMSAGPLGVDVEWIRPMDGELAGFFLPEEQRYLEGLPVAERNRGFFTLWTMKESYCKALGSGIVDGLEVAMLDAEGRLRSSLNGWRIETVNAFAGYSLAFCARPWRSNLTLICADLMAMTRTAHAVADRVGQIAKGEEFAIA
jgi:4'-phosphopantetheinyl transferase